MTTPNYTVQNVDTQFMNQQFIEKINRGLEKEASVSMTAFVRQKLREDGWTRKVFSPIPITSADLDRQLDEEPTVICEKEPDSVAANFAFLGRAPIRYWSGSRYPVTCSTVRTDEFKKSKFELATYRTDIQTVLQENSVKDLQEREDQNLYDRCSTMADANGNIITVSGGLNFQGIVTVAKKMVANKLPVGCILMTQEMYLDLLAQPAVNATSSGLGGGMGMGSQYANDMVRGLGTLDSIYNYPIITTIKNNILPNNQIMVFTTPQYLGQFYTLQDAVVYLKSEADIISFHTYESVGIGIGNVNGVVIGNF